jgi:L-ascorbate metabolism protein UlaG (beta-lactamase superfamily)
VAVDTTEGVVRVAWLGHATVVLDLDGTRVLTDPLLQKNAGPLRRRPPPPDPASWRDVDAVLVSHLHVDHAELGSLRMLGATPKLSAASNASWMRRRGLAGVGSLSERWVRLPQGEVETRLVRADHRHRQMPHRPNAAHGHLLRGRSARIWVAGDTSLHPEMSALADLAGGPVDLALVPVGGWGPRLSPGHMDATQAATAVARSGARYAVPVHWGTLHPPFLDRLGTDWLDEPGRQFAEALAQQAPGCRAVVLAPGEEVRIDLAGRAA